MGIKNKNKTFNVNTQRTKSNKILCNKSLPIKDPQLIEQIKNIYKENQDYRGLLLFLLAINTGLKVEELLNLKVKDVANKSILVVFDSYAKENLTFILTDEIKEIVPLVVEERKRDDYLFVTRFGNRLDRIAVYRNFGKITKTLNVENKYSPLSWRKTFAYHYFKQTNDITKIIFIFHQISIQQAFEFINEEQMLSYELDRKFAL